MVENRVAVITGASRGIGKACACKLAAEGVTVVINYSSSSAAAEEVVSEIAANGGSAKAYKCDVSDSQAVEKMFADIIKEFGRIDILINNAGITRDNLSMLMTEEDFDAVLSTNLKGAFNCIRACLPKMIRSRYGRIINISSISGLHGNPGQANYSAAKAGLIGLTKSVAKEVGKRGITVNAIAPGFIETDMVKGLDEEFKKQFANEIPLKRFGKPEEVADIVAFFASEKASYTTGSVINIDGGLGS